MPRESSGQLKWWGQRYSVRVRFADGQRSWVPLPVGLSHVDAVERAKEIAVAARTSRSTSPMRLVTAGETFEDWCARWIDWRVERGVETVAEDRGRLRNHVFHRLGRHAIRAITREEIEDLRDELDEKIRRGTISWKTALHVWTNVRCVFRDACAAKRRDLRVRDDNPAHDLAGPDRGMQRAKQFLFPSEFLQLVSCEVVPMRWRRIFALTTYLALRAGELEALNWEDVLLDRAVVHIHRSVSRTTREEKTTKTAETRRFLIEPTLLPLLRRLHDEAGGAGRVMRDMPLKFEFSKALRHYLVVAGVSRPELFANDLTRKWITFHDLRATGLTWMAVRGDEALKIKQRAGHCQLATTEIYVRIAESVRPAFGEVFPMLPRSLLAS